MSRFLLLICLFPYLAWADVQVRTQTPPLNTTGTVELAGAMMFTVDRNDFANATSVLPIYIRLTLDHGARLAETLVDYDDPDSGHFHRPIFLPLFTSGPHFQTKNIDAAPNALAIVRWRAGENQIWLRISVSSELWLEVEGQPFPPTETNPVSFGFGMTAGVSDAFHVSRFENPEAYNANLPFATSSLEFPSAVGTLFLVDLSNSNLEPDEIAPLSELIVDPIAFQLSEGVETSPTQNGISLGAQQQINFHGEAVIGYVSADAGALSEGGQ